MSTAEAETEIPVDEPVAAPSGTGPPVRDDSGYYHLPDGRKLLSVTNIIGDGIPKPALVHWAAWEVARCAMDWLPRLVRARGDEARYNTTAWLQKAAERRRDTAADLGSAIHRDCEARVLGKPWPEPTEDQQPFVDAFARFCDRWRPRWEVSELVVANLTDGWAGTCDAWMWLTIPDIGPEPVLICVDYKTGKNIYPESALQVGAYSRAEKGWLRDGTEVTPPRATYGAVLHLRPDKYPKTGGYRLRPVDISGDTYAAFLHAHATAEGWVRGRSKMVLGKAYPEPPPIIREAVDHADH